MSGLTIDTIRFYEKSGLCPAIDRDAGGKREFSSEDADWLCLLSSLRETGMPTGEMRHFAEMYQVGDATIPERKQLLLEHSDRLKDRRADLDQCEQLLAFKLARYDKILGGK